MLLEVSALVAEELEFEIYYNPGWNCYYLIQEYAEQETGARKIELGRRFIIGEYKGWIITRDGHLGMLRYGEDTPKNETI